MAQFTSKILPFCKNNLPCPPILSIIKRDVGKGVVYLMIDLKILGKTMHCDVYKFPKSPDWYVYIARPNYPDDTDELKDWLGVLPSELRAKLGLGSFVMHLDLSVRDKLAQADINAVKAKLTEQGYYVQAPPSDVLMQQALNKVKDGQDRKWD